MPRFGFVGGSYTARSSAIADEECINFYAETIESQGGQTASKSYGGASAQSLRSYYGTPGIRIFKTLSSSPIRGMFTAISVNLINDTLFVVAGDRFGLIDIDGNFTDKGGVVNDGKSVSMAASPTQLFLISANHGYLYDFSSDTFSTVPALTATLPIPVQVEYSDGYFIASSFENNKFAMSAILDGSTWPGLQLSGISVFNDPISSIIVNHRELWVFGRRHAQPFQNTGSDNIFDVIPGTLIEKGNVGPFVPCRVDNSIFWIDEDERGGRSAWRAQGYTPTRISTHAVETDLESYDYNTAKLITTYSYQDMGHMFWVIYIPGAQWSWVYDVPEGLWHKRASWANGAWGPHKSWNHAYFIGKQLVGDWGSGNIYELSMDWLDDNGATIRRQRRAPTVSNEMEWISHYELKVDFETGLGPQPPLTDGNGNPRPPQAVLRWSNNRGKTWSNDHIVNCGMAGEYDTRAIWRRLGRSRYRVYELTVSDPIPWVIVDAYLKTSQDGQ